MASPATPKRKRRWGRAFWLRQLHQWHWISSAIALAGLLLFVVTGFTLNHAADIETDPVIVTSEAVLNADTLAALEPFEEGDAAPLPPQVRAEAGELVGVDLPDSAAEWSEFEVYLAMPQAGGDAWISIDRETGDIAYEHTDRGWIAYLNDLHKGRDTGPVWSWFIDIFVFACLAFILTGFVILWLHARNRPSTWPLTGLGLLVPVALAIFFVH